MNKLTDIVQTIQQTIHLIKPLLFEGVLFAWACIEMGKFIWSVTFGHGA